VRDKLVVSIKNKTRNRNKKENERLNKGERGKEVEIAALSSKSRNDRGIKTINILLTNNC